jgi:hypothetical protein
VRTKRVVAVLAVLALVAAGGYWLGQRWEESPPVTFGTGCTVEVGEQVRLDIDQMANAATIAATGARLGMPEHATVVALATALQESKLRNLPHLGPRNDHDSIGLFQQRPSQGWGTEEQIIDPRYAAERFYLALQAVGGWEEMRITDAAQRVQRSAFPEAYQKWAEDAAVLADALHGRTGAAVSCRLGQEEAPLRGAAAATAVSDELVMDWGEAPVVAGPDHTGVSLAAVDLSAGWRYAHWLVSHASGLGVVRVHFGDLEWRADTGQWDAADGATDHVRAEVHPEA